MANLELLKTLKTKYLQLMNAMQSGVMMQQHVQAHRDAKDQAWFNKDARVGINSALNSNGALVAVLFKKGILTEEEYLESLVATTQEDVDRLKRELADRLQTKVELY